MSEEHVSVSEYTKAFEILFPDGGWFRVPKILHRIRPLRRFEKDGKTQSERVLLKLAAYTLAAALNQSAAQRAVSKNAGWFTFCIDKTEEDTGLGADAQQRHLSLLEECNLIERRRASSVYGKRQVKINYRLLTKLLNKHDDQTSPPPKTANDHIPRKAASEPATNREKRRVPTAKSGETTSKKGLKDPRGAASASRNGHTPPQPASLNGEVHTPFKQQRAALSDRKKWLTGDKPHELAAQQLYKALRKKGRRTIGVGAGVWSEPLRPLSKREANFNAVLAWFCDHCGKGDPSGLPDIANGRQFSEHFDWIEKRWKIATGRSLKPKKLEDIWAGEPEDEVLEQP